ncbi:MAG: molybdopterin-dependent oxidoreductase [bacterium]
MTSTSGKMNSGKSTSGVSTGGEWKKTGCVLCAQNCGLEVLVENNRIVKSKPDRENPRSKGYICRKGLYVADYQHHAQRLTHPLKRKGDGFERISWEQALDEIADKLKSIVGEHGPRALAYVGGGGQGSHMEAAFGARLLRGMGSQYHFNPLGQELTGHFWVSGRFFGRQYLATIPDEHNAEVLVALGWNGWMSHQMPEARRVLSRFSKDPDKLLVAIDPRRSETAKRADIHLALRPGSDALLLKAMIAILLAEGWADTAYLELHTSGFEEVAAWFEDFDARAAAEVCGLDYGEVRGLCEILATRRWALHADLGVLMNRHSTAVSYLYHLLLAVCGRIGVEGGNVIPGSLMPLGAHSDERKPETWRTAASDYPAIMGVFPPNVLPEEIMHDGPERVRAAIVSNSNPLRSYADTAAFEEAFGKLELLVTCDIAMSETAAASHYVLPARSGYESYDGTFFPWSWPDVYFQMRQPVVEPEGEQMEVSEIYTRLARRLGLIPEIPAALREAAKGDRLAFAKALLEFMRAEPKAGTVMPFVLAETLGRELGSANLAALWGMLINAPKETRANAARAGYEPGVAMGERIFQDLLDNPGGMVIGRTERENNLAALRTEDGRIALHIPELADWVGRLDAASEAKALAPDPDFPFVLSAGRRTDANSNTQMRSPSWNLRYRACTVAMHPDDVASLGLADGDMVRVTTGSGAVEGELEIDGGVRAGTVIIPHGFGLVYKGETYGVNVNRLTSSRHRDPFAGTPLHRYIPCRVEPAGAAMSA